MGKTLKNNTALALTRLLRRINQGIDPKDLRRQASQLISKVTSNDIAKAEQSLISNGFTAQLAGELSSIFVLLGILEQQGNTTKEKIPENHILRKIAAEHELMRCFLADFRELVDSISQLDALSDASTEFMKLSHIVEHFNAMEEHIEREEDVIFPFMKKHGWESLCRSSCNDHVYIKIAINDLVRLIGGYDKDKFKDFKVRIASVCKYLCSTLSEHMFQEDYILYPIAMKVIDNEDVWKRIKHVCEEIGYCGVHL